MPFLLLLGCHVVAPPAGDADGSYVTDTAVVNPPDTETADLLFDADHELLVSSIPAFRSVNAEGTTTLDVAIASLVGEPGCDDGRCRVEGITADGEGLLVNWALQNGTESFGGVVRVDPGAEGPVATWEMTGWGYPHEAVRDPFGPYLIVADATLDRILWMPDDGTGDVETPVAAIDKDTAGVGSAHTPNGLWIHQDGARLFLVVSFRGNDTGNPGNEVGRILCFDVTERSAPTLLWTYPPDGNLQAPHNPSFHWRDDRWVLLYAHSHGVRADSGSVGVAQTADLARLPTYIADLVPTQNEWGYPRGAELTADDVLLVTDTGTNGGMGAVFEVPFPVDLRPTGPTGAFQLDGSRQQFVEVDDTMFTSGLQEAYRAFLWTPTF